MIQPNFAVLWSTWMKNSSLVCLCVGLILSGCVGFQKPSDVRDRGVFVMERNEYEARLRSQVGQTPEQSLRQFRVDLSGVSVPDSTRVFQTVWHNPPVSQDLTGSCWAFGSTSFFESEVYRLFGQKTKISEMYTVYWEYVEKARRYVQQKGNSVFGRGSQPNATIRIWKEYGAVPAESYPGRPSESTIQDHARMVSAMQDYLATVQKRKLWDEEEVVAAIRVILDKYMGKPPSEVLVNGQRMSPKDYLSKVLKLDLDAYVNVMSLMQQPFFEQVEYEVADNWWHSSDYSNIPVDLFIKTIRSAVNKGFSVCIAGDTSEAGLIPSMNVALIPTFDITSRFIDDAARQFRFSNSSTTDDHVVHLIGHKGLGNWYLMKDSGTSARNGKCDGYMFYQEDYIKLKMMNFLVHKSILEEVLAQSRP